MKFNYSSNNSGGDWWLTDQNWFDLEKAGWAVDWNKDKKDNFFKSSQDGRWLGSLAQNASKEFETLKEAVEEFEKVAGQDMSDIGCSCCGSPHSMSWYDKNENYHFAYAGDFRSNSRVNPWD
jgi:hypothetical protein